MKRAFVIFFAIAAAAHTSSAAEPPSSSVLRSLPADLQRQIEESRAACREHLTQTDDSSTKVTEGDEGLSLFTVSGQQAVLISDVEICGGKCLRGANCTNRNSYGVAIYIRAKTGSWRKALSTDAVGNIFLSTDWLHGDRFKVLILSVFSGNKDCPTRDVSVREGNESYVMPAWKQSCDAVIKWDGTKFTYKPL